MDPSIWAKIVSYLDQPSLTHMAMLNSEFAELFRTDDWWIMLVNHKGNYGQDKPPNLSWRQYYQQLLWSINSPPKIDQNGDQVWKLCGYLHRWADLPALIRVSGYGSSRIWYRYGQRHRGGDQPAFTETSLDNDLCQTWYQNGLIHRDGDQPAYIEGNGTQHWYQHGLRHRDHDRPAYICKNLYGSAHIWYRYGQRHRDGDQPAYLREYVDGSSQEWWVNGQSHRENGQPAIIRFNNTKEWWVNGQQRPPPM